MKELLTGLARRAYAEGRDLGALLGDMLDELLAKEPELAERPEWKRFDLTAATDPARYTGSAGLLTDRALERS
ncbi:3-carboxy-cis,cis-muconate cycloisomerase [Streptomyces hirsutus]